MAPPTPRISLQDDAVLIYLFHFLFHFILEASFFLSFHACAVSDMKSLYTFDYASFQDVASVKAEEFEWVEEDLLDRTLALGSLFPIDQQEEIVTCLRART